MRQGGSIERRERRTGSSSPGGSTACTAADFIPPSYPAEVELQTLAAIVECTSRELIPKSYRDIPRDELSRRLALLKAGIGEI